MNKLVLTAWKKTKKYDKEGYKLWLKGNKMCKKADILSLKGERDFYKAVIKVYGKDTDVQWNMDHSCTITTIDNQTFTLK